MLLWLLLRVRLDLVTRAAVTEITFRYFAEVEWRMPRCLQQQQQQQQRQPQRNRPGHEEYQQR